MNTHLMCPDLDSAAVILADFVKTQLGEFRRPIRYTVASADGTICAVIDGAMKVVRESSEPGKMMRLPLHILFVDADGLEFTACLDNGPRSAPSPQCGEGGG